MGCSVFTALLILLMMLQFGYRLRLSHARCMLGSMLKQLETSSSDAPAAQGDSSMRAMLLPGVRQGWQVAALKFRSPTYADVR